MFWQVYKKNTSFESEPCIVDESIVRIIFYDIGDIIICQYFGYYFLEANKQNYGFPSSKSRRCQ